MTATSQGASPAEAAAAMALGPDLVAIITHLCGGTGDPGAGGPAAAGVGPAGTVKVRLSGERAGIDAVAAVLARHFQVTGRSGPRRNHYEPGQRVYLTICA